MDMANSLVKVNYKVNRVSIFWHLLWTPPFGKVVLCLYLTAFYFLVTCLGYAYSKALIWGSRCTLNICARAEGEERSFMAVFLCFVSSTSALLFTLHTYTHLSTLCV